jgi:L-phenylalanine/L-methionine N-acetyltransferase
MPPTRLAPERLLVRRAEPADYEAIRAILACPRAQAGTLQLPFPSLELWRQRLLTPIEGYHQLVAEVDGRVVGNIGLHLYPDRPRRRHAATFGMAVHDDWQGMGIGGALLQGILDLADRWLNLTRIELEVYTDNEAAIRLYERAGFEQEGRLRNYAFRDGQYVDAYVMARLRTAVL